MRFLRALPAILLLALAQVATPSHAQPAMPPLEVYGELPPYEDAALSESGDYLAVLGTVGGSRQIIIMDQQNTPLKILPVQDLKIRSMRWLGDDSLLLVRSVTEELGPNFVARQHEFSQALIIPLQDGAEMQMVFGKRRNMVNAVFGVHGVRKIEGKWYGFFGGVQLANDRRNGFRFEHGRPGLYRVDLARNKHERVDPPPPAGVERDWLIDAAGQVAVRLDIDDNSGRWKLRNSAGKEIANGANTLGAVWLVALGSNGSSVIYGERADGSINWYEMPLDGSATATSFLADEDVKRLYFDRHTGQLLGFLRDGPEPEPVFFDPERQNTARRVREAFAGRNMAMIEWTREFDKIVVATDGNQDSGSWYFVDLANKRAEHFMSERPAIAAAQVGPISTFAYAAGDGLELDGILTLPPGREGKNLPVIVLPHGGPHSHDAVRFDWEAQAYASRGYAVFQPNFRGSTNKDAEFRRAGYGQWGRLMQTDVTDGLAALAAAGIVDPTRACIVGGSYGGYAALAGVTLQRGQFRCAVAIAPVVDLKMTFRQDYRESGRARTARRSLLETLGPQDGFDAVSPLRHARHADAPIMLIHGKDDTVVPYEHSRRMADALKDHDRPHELVTLDGEDHWLSRSETRKAMLAAAVRFVEKHNPPD